MNASYTKKEFVDAFDDQVIKDFFKHIDRMTGTVNFFSFFGIDPHSIKAENGHNYSIKAECAPLLAAMIRAFQYVYGNDRRGYPEGEHPEIDYQEYHEFVSKMKDEVERLEPYQQALIKNYRSYDNAIVIDRFAPLLIERLSVLLTMLFCYGQKQTGDNFIEMIRVIDDCIDALAKRRVQAERESEGSADYTFNDAISGAFNLLAGVQSNMPDVSQVSSTELIMCVKKALDEASANEKGSRSREEMLEEATKSANAAYEQYRVTHQDKIKLHSENIENEIKVVDSRWVAASNITPGLLSQLPEDRWMVQRIIEMRNAHGEYRWMKDAFDGKILWEQLNPAAYARLNETDRLVYDTFRYSLSNYVTEAQPGSEEYVEFMEKRVKEWIEFRTGAAWQQSELHSDPERIVICEMYKTEKQNKYFGMVKAYLDKAVAKLLTRQLGK